jgi:hypothetical protein
MLQSDAVLVSRMTFSRNHLDKGHALTRGFYRSASMRISSLAQNNDSVNDVDDIFPLDEVLQSLAIEVRGVLWSFKFCLFASPFQSVRCAHLLQLLAMYHCTRPNICPTCRYCSLPSHLGASRSAWTGALCKQASAMAVYMSSIRGRLPGPSQPAALIRAQTCQPSPSTAKRASFLGTPFYPQRRHLPLR